jgi:hypothetical protein
MNRTKITLFGAIAVVVAVGLVFAIRTNTPGSTKDARGAIAVVPAQPSTTRELDPFTHVASIPATVDPSTIRFEKLKIVDLASKTQTTTDPNDCKERKFREPDGSSCESVKVLEHVKAIEADYSFVGPQSSTGEGETGPTRQTFAVYFRPEEVPVSSVSKLKREQAASLFRVTTSRPIVQERVIDKQNSRFCPGNYVDGSWVQTDPNCKEQVQYATRTAPAEYWAVDVDLGHPILAKR